MVPYKFYIMEQAETLEQVFQSLLVDFINIKV